MLEMESNANELTSRPRDIFTVSTSVIIVPLDLTAFVRGMIALGTGA